MILQKAALQLKYFFKYSSFTLLVKINVLRIHLVMVIDSYQWQILIEKLKVLQVRCKGVVGKVG